MERGRSRWFLDDDPPSPPPVPHASGAWQRLRFGLTDRFGWKGLAYGAVMLPWGIITFTVAVTLWSLALGLTTLPLFDWALPDGGFEFGSYRLAGLGLVGAYTLSVCRCWRSRPAPSMRWPRVIDASCGCCCRPTRTRCSSNG